MTYINIILLAFIFVFVLDYSGAWDEVTAKISRWLTNGHISKPIDFKPFSCSLCMTFWAGLGYLLYVHQLTIGNVAYVCLVAGFTPRINDIIIVVDHIITKILHILNR